MVNRLVTIAPVLMTPHTEVFHVWESYLVHVSD